MEIWDQRCERFLELVSGDFGLAADGAAPTWGSLICGKNIAKKKGEKLHYKGLIVVISGIESLDVEPIVCHIQESTIWVSKEAWPLAETKVIGKVGWQNLVFYGKKRFHIMV